MPWSAAIAPGTRAFGILAGQSPDLPGGLDRWRVSGYACLPDGERTMVVVVLLYPAYLPTIEETAARCEPRVPRFEADVPGLIDKTWGMNEEQGTMCSVYHFEDRVSAEAYFATEPFLHFRDITLQGQMELEYFEVVAVASKGPLK